ncbi:MAG: hypothetical protein JJW00_00500 [Sulfurimonas sp.]|nr:hypothetical protein [Sulfurimonas sp.]
MKTLTKFYTDHRYNDSIFENDFDNDRNYWRAQKDCKELLDFQRMVKTIADDTLLSQEELGKNQSLKLSVIIDAFSIYFDNLTKKQSDRDRDDYEYKITKQIAEKYKDTMLSIVEDRDITKNLSEAKKRVLRDIKDKLDPTNSLNYVHFKDYDNSLAMIAFMAGHLKGKKKITQKRAKEIVEKILINSNKSAYIANVDYSLAKPVFLYCVNNMSPYLSYAMRKKLLKFIFENIEDGANELFFTLVEKVPDDYIDVLFDKSLFISRFDKFTEEELNIFVSGIKRNDTTISHFRDKIDIITRRISLQTNYGNHKAMLADLKPNKSNMNLPYLLDIFHLFDAVNYNIKHILLKLGYSRDDY